MIYSLDRTIDATVEPVTLDQAKSHCRIQIDDDDAIIPIYISAARQLCEEATGRAFLQQTWRLSLEAFPRYRWPYAGTLRPGDHQRYLYSAQFWTPSILLPRPKLIGIGSITYLDSTGTRQTLDPSQYVVDADGEPATISPAIGCYWPFALERKGSVQITYTAGYGNAAGDVPAALQLAVLQLVGHWYENREATILPESGTGLVNIPLGVSEILQAYTLDVFTLES